MDPITSFCNASQTSLASYNKFAAITGQKSIPIVMFSIIQRSSELGMPSIQSSSSAPQSFNINQTCSTWKRPNASSTYIEWKNHTSRAVKLHHNPLPNINQTCSMQQRYNASSISIEWKSTPSTRAVQVHCKPLPNINQTYSIQQRSNASSTSIELKSHTFIQSSSSAPQYFTEHQLDLLNLVKI